MVSRRSYIWLSVVVTAMLLVTCFTPRAIASGPALDLTLDADRDGVPDSLAREVMLIQKAADPEAVLASMAERLPYSAKTRELQQKAGELIASLSNIQSYEEFEKLNLQLLDLSEDDRSKLLAGGEGSGNYCRTAIRRRPNGGLCNAERDSVEILSPARGHHVLRGAFELVDLRLLGDEVQPCWHL